MKKLEEPSNIDELHHFQSLTGYYRKFVLLFDDITKPLNKLLYDIKYQWLPQCQAAFEYKKKFLCKVPILLYPNMENPYTLFTDAGHYAYSGVLTQAVESPEDLRPIASMLGPFSDNSKDGL